MGTTTTWPISGSPVWSWSDKPILHISLPATGYLPFHLTMDLFLVANLVCSHWEFLKQIGLGMDGKLVVAFAKS